MTVLYLNNTHSTTDLVDANDEVLIPFAATIGMKYLRMNCYRSNYLKFQILDNSLVQRVVYDITSTSSMSTDYFTNHLFTITTPPTVDETWYLRIKWYGSTVLSPLPRICISHLLDTVPTIYEAAGMSVVVPRREQITSNRVLMAPINYTTISKSLDKYNPPESGGGDNRPPQTWG